MKTAKAVQCLCFFSGSAFASSTGATTEAPANLVLNVFFLLLGWLLGIFSPLIVDYVKRRYQKNDVRRGIVTELKEIRSRLGMSVAMLATRLGKYDRNLLIWTERMLQEYEGTEPKEEVLKAIQGLLKLTDEQLAAIAKQVKFQPGGALSLKTYTVSFLDANMSLLSLFPVEFQNRILEVRAQIGLLNQEISESSLFYWKTFDSSITAENHKIITDSLLRKYEIIEGASRRLADKIGNVAATKKKRLWNLF
jgi:transcriptional regulator with XRE-family HTH domain